MFSSNPLDKNCVSPDNCSSARNNATRFPLGMTSLGDENQQIRIQLAVHKYNSSANNNLNNRCSVISPIRHSFLKNSLKAKNFEGDTERTTKSEKKNENKYEGVGAFPTIHLKKSAVRYRPIRRFNDVKILYPELPVNRFLSHLPEVNSDLKSGARSVLDVLEDLSGKKIHSNEENKPKLKGLGGDYLSNPNPVYKPLFVQKPKISSVLTRDNTTQTISSADTETSSPKSSNSFMMNDTLDPRVELRRKLAKQNNEIFASLSSSISSSFALKRKIDKVLLARDDDHLNEGSITKKSKISDRQYKNSSDNDDSRSATKHKSKIKPNDSTNLNKNSKPNEATSPSSPNKDRLTTIYLDMQTTNSKAQIFVNDSAAMETSIKNSSENGLGGKTNLSNGFGSGIDNFGNKSISSVINDFPNTNNSEGYLKNSSSIGFTEKVDSPDIKKENEQWSKPMFNFPASKTITTQNDANKSVGNCLTSSDVSANVINGTYTESRKDDVQILNKPFSARSSNVKPDFSSFKFGAEGNVSQALTMPSKDSDPPKSTITEVTPLGNTIASSIAPQLHFESAATVTSTASQPSPVSFGVTVTQSTMTNPVKPMFTFGQNESLSKPTLESAVADEKAKTPNPASKSIPVTTQSIQSGMFNFGQKLSAESSGEIISDKNTVSLSGPVSQSNITDSSHVATISSTDSAPATLNDKGVSNFGKKTETSTTSSAPIITSQEQKFTFSFTQKPDTDQGKSPEGFEQKSSNLFPFGQKSTTQESSQSTNAATNATSPNQLPVTQPTSLFGQNASQSTGTLQEAFGQASVPQTKSNFEAKSEAESLSSVTAPNSSQGSTDFTAKAPLFTPASGFETASTRSSIGFGTTTSSASGFKFGASATTQSTSAFSVSSAPQTVHVFGTSSASQSASGFGSYSTTQSAGAISTPAFAVSRQTPFTFGISTTTQSPSSFGATTATESTPIFGMQSTTQSTSAYGPSSSSLTTSGFGTTTTTQSTPGFGASPSQPNTSFGAPPSTQSALRFGAATAQDNTSFGASAGFSTASSTLSNNSFSASTVTSNSGFGGSQSSFSQPFGNKPPATSLGQTSNIFGQNPVQNFSSTTAFSSNQNNVFGQKPNTEGNMFDQNKIQAPGFGAGAQPFGTQNKFSFGMSTPSNVPSFTNSPSNNTTAPVFNFGGNSTGNTFSFGNNPSVSTSTAPFAFKSVTNEPFKFSASTSKEGSGFGGSSTTTFSFSGPTNNNAMAEQKPAFSFGNVQVSSSSPFNFGTTPSPAVFSFGGSTSASSGSGFNFGTPTPGGPFGQATTASPGAPFAVPGTFSIGSGSSQSRPRATSRPRRRP